MTRNAILSEVPAYSPGAVLMLNCFSTIRALTNSSGVPCFFRFVAQRVSTTSLTHVFCSIFTNVLYTLCLRIPSSLSRFNFTGFNGPFANASASSYHGKSLDHVFSSSRLIATSRCCINCCSLVFFDESSVILMSPTDRKCHSAQQTTCHEDPPFAHAIKLRCVHRHARSKIHQLRAKHLVHECVWRHVVGGTRKRALTVVL